METKPKPIIHFSDRHGLHFSYKSEFKARAINPHLICLPLNTFNSPQPFWMFLAVCLRNANGTAFSAHFLGSYKKRPFKNPLFGDFYLKKYLLASQKLNE